MDTSTLGIVTAAATAGITGLAAIVRQIRIGLRDRRDRRGVLEAEDLERAKLLVELRKAQTVSAILEKRRRTPDGQSAPPQETTGGKEAPA